MVPLSVISVPMSPGQVNPLRQSSPFLYRLLITSEITTTLLEKALQQPLQSEQKFTATDVCLHRRNYLFSDETLIELAEIRFLPPFPEWSRAIKPLGPFLLSQEFELQKKYITPLHFPPHQGLQTLFALSEPQSCYGRRYEFHVTKKSASWNLPVIEVWNPSVYSLPFTPLA